jgi:WD40 repeat protein
MSEEEPELQVLSEHESQVTCLNFNHRNNFLVSGSLDNAVIVWDTISNTAVVK